MSRQTYNYTYPATGRNWNKDLESSDEEMDTRSGGARGRDRDREDTDEPSSPISKGPSKVSRGMSSMNEVLARALADAASPGALDEEPEKLGRVYWHIAARDE
jgi:hypothetical protein